MENKMNNQRRKQLDEVIAKIEEATSLLETLRDEEQESFDNMPEGLQQGDRGQATEASASALDEAVNALDEVLSQIKEAQQ